MFRFEVYFVFLLASFEVLACPEIISRSQWGAVAGKNQYKLPKDLPYVLIHHTESPECNSLDECKARIRSIQDYHMNTRKWDDIGYNFLIDPQGNIYSGRGFSLKGIHSPNYNSNSIGISVIGNYASVSPSDKALKAVNDIIYCGLIKGYINQHFKLLGHRQTRSTDCPGDKFYSIIKTWSHWSAQP